MNCTVTGNITLGQTYLGVACENREDCHGAVMVFLDWRTYLGTLVKCLPDAGARNPHLLADSTGPPVGSNPFENG